jgi:hypothetical protein
LNSPACLVRLDYENSEKVRLSRCDILTQSRRI